MSCRRVSLPYPATNLAQDVADKWSPCNTTMSFITRLAELTDRAALRTARLTVALPSHSALVAARPPVQRPASIAPRPMTTLFCHSGNSRSASIPTPLDWALMPPTSPLSLAYVGTGSGNEGVALDDGVHDVPALAYLDSWHPAVVTGFRIEPQQAVIIPCQYVRPTVAVEVTGDRDGAHGVPTYP